MSKLRLGALITFILIVGGVVAVRLASTPRPVGEEGAEAEALALSLEQAVNVSAWEQTGAVTWTFGGRNTHLWDRQRGLLRVEWGQDNRALLNMTTMKGRAWRGEVELTEGERQAALDYAYGAWINDSFWLNPLAKLRDQGVSRSLVRWEGQQALLVSYSSGGLTPGDAYLWVVDGAEGLPSAWHMWVSILPVGGVRATWERWVTLSTGAKVATRHVMPLFTLELTDVAGASSVGELVPGPDPFSALMEGP